MTLLFEEAYWANSYLSVARYSGGVTIENESYIVVNKFGQTLFESSIPPKEPADLVVEFLIPYYKKLGREEFLKVIKRLPVNLSKKELIEKFKELTKKPEKKKDTSKQLTLF